MLSGQHLGAGKAANNHGGNSPKRLNLATGRPTGHSVFARGFPLKRFIQGGTQDTDVYKGNIGGFFAKNLTGLFVISGYLGKALGTVFRPF